FWAVGGHRERSEGRDVRAGVGGTPPPAGPPAGGEPASRAAPGALQAEPSSGAECSPRRGGSRVAARWSKRFGSGGAHQARLCDLSPPPARPFMGHHAGHAAPTQSSGSELLGVA